MRKKFVVLMVLVAVVLSSIGCNKVEPTKETSSESKNSAVSSSQEGGGVIGLFMTHMSNEFTIALSSSVEAQVKARGYECKIYDAKQDAQTQQNQIEQAIASGINGIVVEPVSVDGVVPAVKFAKEQGIPVVIVNQRISDPKAADVYVGADSVVTGEVLMKKVVEDLGGKGSIALLLGPMGSDAQVGRSKGFSNILAKNPDVKVEYETSANWATEPALSTTENWLSSGKKIDAIVSQNDGMAIGAAKAVSDAGLKGKIMVYGVDATKEGLQAVLNDDLKASISQGTTDQGRMAADACADLIEKKTVEPEIIVANEVFVKENAKQFLESGK